MQTDLGLGPERTDENSNVADRQWSVRSNEVSESQPKFIHY